MKAAAIVLSLALGISAQNGCDPLYTCEYYFGTSGGLTYWNFQPLCSPEQGYTHTEEGRNDTVFSFNICGLSPVKCPPDDPNTTLPSFGVAVQESGGICYISGEGFPNFTPVDPSNPVSGGINITHEAAPEPANSAKACATDGERIVSRSTKYMMLCDPNIDGLETDFAYEESECQYVIVMRSKHGCGVANSPDAGGNCLAPPQPPGLTQTCSAATTTLSQNMIGYNAEYKAWNEACLDMCDPTVPTTCSAVCQHKVGEYSGDCQAQGGALYSLAEKVTFDNGEVVSITSYTCIASECTDEANIQAFQTYISEVQCSSADAAQSLPTSCGVTVTASDIQPTPSPSPGVSSSPSPGASASPTRHPAPASSSPSPRPAGASPSPSPAAAAGDGGAVAGAIFATFAGLAVVAFGGYHVGTRTGYVSRESVPSRARYCLECECINQARNSSLFNRPRVPQASAFTSASAVGGGGTAAPSPTVGGGALPPGGYGSSAGGYSTI